MLEQAIGEATGGDPTVQAGAALDSNREGIKACEQLLATAETKRGGCSTTSSRLSATT